MRTLRRMASAGQVWLAAALVLFANVPHFVCRCPDGHVKPVCFGAADGSACCCGGAGCCAAPSGGGCCRPQAPSHHAASCCAAGHRPERPESLSGGCQGGGCARTLAPAEDYVPTAGKASGPDLTAATILLPPSLIATGQAVASRSSAWWPDHSLSPPPDLVTLLQHLLI